MTVCTLPALPVHPLVDTILLTSLSGAGRTEALRTFEDLGYFCLDRTLPALVATLAAHHAPLYPKLVFGLEAHPNEDIEAQILEVRYGLKERGRVPLHLFLDCSDEVLLGRYALSRRPHPWFERAHSLQGAIEMERAALAGARALADAVIDTSALGVAELRSRLTALLVSEPQTAPVTLMSFGFKRGIPADAQFVIDIRFLPNPYYDLHLRPLSGRDAPVCEYVFGCVQAQQTYTRLSELLRFLLGQYRQDRRGQLLFAVGCTGGQHRSVAFVERLVAELRSEGIGCHCIHRDLAEEPAR